MNDAAVFELFVSADLEFESTVHEGLRAFVHAEIQKMRKSVKFSGATVD